MFQYIFDFVIKRLFDQKLVSTQVVVALSHDIFKPNGATLASTL